MNKKLNILAVNIIFLIFTACGSANKTASHSDYKNNYEINSFWKQFNKSEFIQTIENKKLNVEKYVIDLKNSKLENKDIILLYTEVQESYNDVLNTMEVDINSINNILDFSTFNATNRYQAQLQLAEKKETMFINAALRLKNPNAETSFFGDLFNGLLSFIPGLSTAQSIYLDFIKQDLNVQLNNAKWKSWNLIK